jgi:hypothetical protein
MEAIRCQKSSFVELSLTVVYGQNTIVYVTPMFHSWIKFADLTF